MASSQSTSPSLKMACPVMGVVYAPAITQMFWGEYGKGAGFANTQRKTTPLAT